MQCLNFVDWKIRFIYHWNRYIISVKIFICIIQCETIIVPFFQVLFLLLINHTRCSGKKVHVLNDKKETQLKIIFGKCFWVHNTYSFASIMITCTDFFLLLLNRVPLLVRTFIENLLENFLMDEEVNLWNIKRELRFWHNKNKDDIHSSVVLNNIKGNLLKWYFYSKEGKIKQKKNVKLKKKMLKEMLALVAENHKIKNRGSKENMLNAKIKYV